METLKRVPARVRNRSRRWWLGTLAVLVCVSPAPAQTTQQVDSLVLAWQSDPSLVARIGLSKLNRDEQRNLARLAISMYLRGQGAVEGSPATSSASDLIRRGTSAYLTKIENASNDAVTLRNRAIVELTSGYLSIATYRDAVLLASGARCRLWVEGKRTYPCRILKRPTTRAQEGFIDMLSSVNADGKVLRMASGTMYEVQFQSYITSIWIPGAEIFDFGDGRLLNLDDGSEIVTVTTLIR